MEPTPGYGVVPVVTVLTRVPAATHDDFLNVAPAHPDAPGVPFPRIADDAFDAELAALSSDRDQVAWRVAFLARLGAIAASTMLLVLMRHDVMFALSSADAITLPTSANVQELAQSTHRLVAMNGVPGAVGAVEYRRPLDKALYRLAPLVERPDVFVEVRIPEGTDPVRWVPPTHVEGRLVSMDAGGARFRHARALLSARGTPVPAQVYILEQGARPRLTSPTVMLAIASALVGLVQALMLVLSLRRKPTTAA